MKIVINRCYGGYGLSIVAMKQLIELKSKAIEKTSVAELKVKEDLKDYKDCGDGYRTKYGVVLYKYGFFYTVNSSMRTDKKLIKVVEKLGEEANGNYAELQVIEIPDGISYEISEYDGMEHIAEKHRTWR